MHLRNKRPVLGLVFLFLFSAFALQARAQNSQDQPRIQPPALPSDVDPGDPALPVWMRPAAPAANRNPSPAGGATTPGTPSGNNAANSGNNAANNVPPDNENAAPGKTGEVTADKGSFRYRKEVEEVTLSATVVDQRQHLVTDLGSSSFVVYEDDQPQKILYFRREDIPVSIGIIVDNSGSMRQKRSAVTKAVLNLVKASNPQDEAFVVNFNDEPYLDQDFTGDAGLLHEALDRMDSRGGTALYDAVIASSEHLAKLAKREKKALLVITDGEDNESRESLEQAIRDVQNDNGPTIYTIGILGSEGKERRARRALEALSIQTGGVAFFPKNLSEVDDVSQEVARDIRNQYTITYKPSNPKSNGGFRKVKVVAHASGYKDLQVRTKSGYFAGQQRAAK